MPFIETADKTTLFYNDWGSGPPVVLIHGWPLDSSMWEYQSTYLAAQGMRCIAYDRRGFGRSAPRLRHVGIPVHLPRVPGPARGRL